MKIYTDENIEIPVVEGLRRKGINIISARELGNPGKSYEFHIKEAYKIDAVILTQLHRFFKNSSKEGT